MENELKIVNLVKKYKNIIAVNELEMELKNGIHGLVGPNGAGKTTLIRCIVDYFKPDLGMILFNGKDVYNDDFKMKLGYLPQNFDFYPFFSIIDTIKYFCCLKKSRMTDEEVDELVRLVNLQEQKKKKVGNLSGGMKRRLGIALAFVGNPDVIILDEPTAGLDPIERIRVKDILKSLKEEKIILVSTHIISDLEAICDDIYFLDNGKLVGKEVLDEKGKLKGLLDIEEKYYSKYKVVN